MKTRLLLNEQFRRGSLYQLVEWNQAGQYVKELLSGMHKDTELYGVFVPLNNMTGLTIKAASKEVAMLFFHLQHSSKIPHYYIASAEEDKNEAIAKLVMDGIIEIKWNDRFVTGTASLTALFDNAVVDDSSIPGCLSALSVQAIHAAWLQHQQDLKSLASKLYSFNSIPWDADRRSFFTAKHSIKEFLFSLCGTAVEKQLNKEWTFVTGAEKRGWLSWIRPPENDDDFLQTHKLYISAFIDDMPLVISKAIPVINASAAISFKTGSNIAGLLRPDKMVVYFINEASLLQTAALLEKELDGCRAQGVPFSKQLDKNGLLSYGIDPPESEVLDAIEEGSWRTTIADKLALAILQTKNDGLNWHQSFDFIKAYLLLNGIDPKNWIAIN